MNAIKLLVIQGVSGQWLLCSANRTVLRHLHITNPTPQDLQAMAHYEYPEIPCAEWFVTYDDNAKHYQVLYVPF